MEPVRHYAVSLTIYDIVSLLPVLKINPFSAKSYPFRLEFYSDGFEAAQAAIGEAKIAENFQTGFKLRWQQQTCWND